LSAVEWAKAAEAHGAGELLLTAIDREGSWSGFDTVLTRSVAQSVDIPVIAHGGAGSIEHIRDVVTQGGASAVAVGSMVVFQKKNMGVLVNFPDQSALRAAIG
jgi:cyclase